MKLLLLIFLTFLLSTNVEASDLIRAKHLIAQKQYAKAILLLENETSPKARYYQGWCYYKIGDCSTAVVQFNDFLNNYNGTGNEPWKAEAVATIQKCGGEVMRNTSAPVVTNTGEEERPISKPITPQVNGTKAITKVNSQIADTDTVERQTSEPVVPNVNNTKAISKPNSQIANSEKVKRPARKPLTPQINNVKVIPEINSRVPNSEKGEQPRSKPIIPQKNDIRTVSKTNSRPEESDDVETHVAKPIRLHIGRTKAPTKTNNQNKKAENLAFTSKDNSSHYKVFLGTENHPNKQFLSLMQLGPVYSEKVSNNAYAYFLGHHTNVDKALGLAEKVKAKGLNARVMKFDKGEIIEDNAHLFSESGDGKITYMVLLNISNESEEDKKRLNKIKYLGELRKESQEREGYVTTYSIGKLNSYNEAKLLLKKLKIAGFKNAVIGALENENREDLPIESVSVKKNYMVLLNVLNDSKEENQRLGLLRNLGELRKENEGEDVDISVYSIGKLMTFNDAKMLLNKVKELGFENVAIGTADK